MKINQNYLAAVAAEVIKQLKTNSFSHTRTNRPKTHQTSAKAHPSPKVSLMERTKGWGSVVPPQEETKFNHNLPKLSSEIRLLIALKFKRDCCLINDCVVLTLQIGTVGSNLPETVLPEWCVLGIIPLQSFL